MSRWDGTYKGKTKNCSPQCPHYLNFQYSLMGPKQTAEVCNWGAAVVRLVEVDNPRKCEYIKKEPHRKGERTIEDIIVTLKLCDKRELKRKAKNEKNFNYQLLFDFMTNGEVIECPSEKEITRLTQLYDIETAEIIQENPYFETRILSMVRRGRLSLSTLGLKAQSQ